MNNYRSSGPMDQDRSAPGAASAAQQPSGSPGKIELPQLSLPKGGGAIKGIEEKFQVNAATGTSSFSIPIPVSPSRQGFSPALELYYNSGGGNGAFGLGWQLAIPSIKRKTERQLPRYRDEEESDIFILSGAEDLVPLLEETNSGWHRYIKTVTSNGVEFTVYRYRPRLEGAFVRIEKWKNNATGETHWHTVTPGNVHSYFGLTPESRIADPKDASRVAEWLLCRTHDDKGNISIYRFKKEDFANVPPKLNEKNRSGNCTQTYLKQVWYGNKAPYYTGDAVPGENDFLFKVIFDYGEHDDAEIVPSDIITEKRSWPCRKDPFSDYRPGFEIRTYRRCNRVLIFHCFDVPDLPRNPLLVKSLQLFYDHNAQLGPGNDSIPGFSFLKKAKQNGHIWDAINNNYTTQSFPEIEFSYQPLEWDTSLKIVSPGSIANAPAGVDNRRYLWVDLYNEGIAGILTEQAGAWFYKSNLGNGDFSPAQTVISTPGIRALSTGTVSIQEIAGDGMKYLVQYENQPKGFFKLSEDDEWQPFKTFQAFPQQNISDANTRPIDLNGDGMADLLVAEETQFRWYKGMGEEGFELAESITKEIDEEKGPAVVFADGTQSIFLADINGDGLTDIIRIRNGEICYWPNLGYGRFGAKVNMDNAPVFDQPDTFNPALLRIADIDGSGVADIVYLGKNDFRVWLNMSGNEWATTPRIINTLPQVDNLSDVSVVDFLGAGTSCIVYTTLAPGKSDRPLQYIDLMGGKKPHLLSAYKNNCGKEVSLEYRSSTQFYLDDKKQGRKWITRLPFPVHCISRVKTEDKIRQTVYVCSYRYSHGYYDHAEREFRGFGRVEQLDTEDFSQFKLNKAKNVVEEAMHQPPVRIVSWFHTGVFIRKAKVFHQYESEYFQNAAFTEYDMPDAVMEDDLTDDELREAHRACKGMLVRSEVYADDETELSQYPFTVSATNVEIRRFQPKANNRFACFLTIPSESIAYNYERNPADPRIVHTFVLEADELGTQLKKASVVYKRVQRPMGNDAIPGKVWTEQSKQHIVYNETSYTNDIDTPEIYRLRANHESKGYDVGGIDIPAGTFISKASLRTRINNATEILFEQEFTGGDQKRLTSHTRRYFLKDDLSGPLPLGTLSQLGLGHRSYQLVYTKNLVVNFFGSKVNDAMLTGAGYMHTEADEHWWAPSGEAILPANPKNKFYTIIGSRDIFNNETVVEYDKYFIAIISITDAINNKVTGQFDYRILAPVLITDANLNRSAVQTNELGLVTATAVMGKDGAGEGDTLADPTTRSEYEFFNWKNNGKPNFSHSFVREKHGPANTRWQESITYSDGSGHNIMVKVQAEPGKALHWNELTKTVREVDADPRWIGNGRTIVNNKGKTIKQFDPYFSTTSGYESEDELVETGFSAVIYYDAGGRNIRTDYPNGTFTKSVFDAWFFKKYDANDTVKDSQWYIDRGSPNPDADAEPQDPQRRAAWLAAKHHDTPFTIHTDSRGRNFYTIADHGNGKTTAVFSETDTQGRFTKRFDQKERNVSETWHNLAGVEFYSKTAEKGESWILTDAMSRMVKMWDNNQLEFRMSFDKLHRPVSNFMKANGSETLISFTVYGDGLPNATALNMKGKVHKIFDQAGVVSFSNIDFKGSPLTVEKKLLIDYKNTADWAALDGLTTLADIDNAAAPLLESETFVSTAELDAINRPLSITLPDNTILRTTFNEANFPETIEVNVRGTSGFVTFLEDQDYDAKGQKQFAKFGNGLITNYFYDPKTWRLERLVTKANGAADAQSSQQLFYTFDPVGNIVHTKDDAQQTHFFNNAVVKPESKFEYDALYQLISATGREHAGLGANTQRSNADLPFITQLPHENDSQAVRNYSEQYEYDDLGNILSLRHFAPSANWTQFYHYQYHDDANNKTNRLQSTSMPGDPINGPYTGLYSYDFHGNMTSMPHLSNPNSLVWDYADQLRKVDLGGGGTAYYVYSGTSGRMRKVIERPGGKRIERIYLGTLEIYREYSNNSKRLERNTLHVLDNSTRIAQIDTKLLDLDNADDANPLNADLIRYQYANHLGSATMETDEAGAVLSYEEYHPFGTSAYRSSKSDADLSLKRYRFSGKEKDEETGFYYFGARYYAPWLGRWTSTDPAGFVSGFNLFRYCSNNPVTFHDPNGMKDYPTIWSTGQKLTKEEQAIVDNPASDPAEVLKVFQAHGYKGGGPLEWKDDYGAHGGWVKAAPTDNPIATGGNAGQGAGDKGKQSDSAGKDTRAGDKGNTTGASPGGAQTGGAKGSDKGSDKGSETGSEKGSPNGKPGGSDQGSANGNATTGSANGQANGSANGQPNGNPNGQGGGSGQPGENGSGSGGGGRKYITNSFWRGLFTGFAIAAAIVLFVALAPITIPASVAIGAAVVGVGLTAYSITQAVRQRDLLNRPISEEQANYNLGAGIGGIFGGLFGGAIAGPTAGATNQLAQGMRSLAPEFATAGASFGGEATAVVTASGTGALTGTGIAQGTNVMMMTGSGGGGDNGGNGDGDDSGYSGSDPRSREYFDGDDAAEAVLGKGATLGDKIKTADITSPEVQAALRSMGYDPSQFKSVYYNASGPKGNYIINVFELDGDIFFGPHISSMNWKP